MQTFDEDRLRESLSGLEPWRQIAFMVLCCERMLPNYERFAAESGFGDVQPLREAVEAAWTWLESDRKAAGLARLRATVERQAPNTEEFASAFTSAALDAANAVATLLDAVERPDNAAPVEVACLARDTVDIYVQESGNLYPNRPDFEQQIQRHELMQAELLRQHDDLSELERWSGSRVEATRRLGAKARRSSMGSLAERPKSWG